jgi:hypothetical protein
MARKREVPFSHLGPPDADQQVRLDRIEHQAAEKDPVFAETARRWTPTGEPEPQPATRGLYDWIGTETTIFLDVPESERRVCSEWLRGARQADIARRCKIKQRSVRRIVADFKNHLCSLGGAGRMSMEDLEEYIDLLGGNVPATIAKLKQWPTNRSSVYTPAEIQARTDEIVARLEKHHHGKSVIGLPPLPHRSRYRRPRRKR